MANGRTLSAHAGSTARTSGIILMSMVLWSLTAGGIFADSPENPANAKPAKAALLAVPLSFEANQGQTDSQVKFLSHGDGYSLFLYIERNCLHAADAGWCQGSAVGFPHGTAWRRTQRASFRRG